MSDWTTTAALVFGCVVSLYIGRRVLEGRSPYPLPPGPPGLPWAGNVIGINTDAPWTTYAGWAKTYGNMVYSRLLGKEIIIINSEKIAKDLLERRSRNYSDRPHFVTTEMYGLGFSSILMHYGDRWRLHRRFFHQSFRLDSIARFLPLQHRKTCDFLVQLFENPGDLDSHVFEYTSTVILNSVYNYDPPSRKDELLDIAATALPIFVAALRPDVSVMLNAFPLLLHLPSWFPGMSFKKEMVVAREFSKLYLERPFEYSVQKMASIDGLPSMVHDALRAVEENGVSPEESWMVALKEASGTAFLAAAETSHSVVMTFFLMMVLNQEVQEKAHAQIDAVVGRTRLPTIEDRPLLPFLDAIFWETLRYSPVAPLSIPHAALEDDVYGGYYIPKGTVLLANLWSMAHDENRYTNPHAFMPERFLNKDGSLKLNEIEHITTISFGLGRRICPGRHFADGSIWNVIVKVLAVFKILKPLDENGVEIPMEAKFSGDLTVHPLPFKCRIVPRLPGMNAKRLEELIAASTA